MDIESNIEQMLQSENAWEFVLLDIVKAEDLDPWDIDISKLTSKYTARVNEMKQLDLRVPARLILTVSILLKMKSELLLSLDVSGSDDDFTDFTDEDLFDQDGDERELMADVPDLNINVKRKHIRKITLGDLIDKLKVSMEPPKPRGRKIKFKLDLPEEDISEKIDNLYKQIVTHSLKKIPFSNLTEKKNCRGIVETFLPLLHLANEHKVTLHQEEFFKELYVENIDEAEKKVEEKVQELEEPVKE
jgi:chromatin segregation and condensation protein Rec8/ScpA/Scc1 (kleisin family)